MKCYECKWPNVQKSRDGQVCCPRCGAKARLGATGEPAQPERIPKVVLVYVAIFAVMGLLLPFLTPLLIEFSLAHP